MLNRNIQTTVKLRSRYVIESTKDDIEAKLRAGSVTVGDWQAGGLEEIKLISYQVVEGNKDYITFAVQCRRELGMDATNDDTAKMSILENLPARKK